ncbi:MAG: hypothetical protein H6932_01015 [Burkholderiaceae bacterium]|nr:hypothetical protein [Burkholderiaceae bacterium]
MDTRSIRHAAAAALLAALATTPARADTPVQVGPSGRTFASAAVLCLPDAAVPGSAHAAVQAGLLATGVRSRGTVRLDGRRVARVTTTRPSVTLTLPDGPHDLEVTVGRGLADHYAFVVAPGQCVLPDTSGNTMSPDGTLETAASGHSTATVTPGCALNPATGEVQPFVNLFANGNVLLNVSVNGVPLTQLGPTHPSTPVFLQAGLNMLSAAAGGGAVDHYVRDAGDGRCTINP